MAADAPLFQNHDHALRFAYGKRMPIIDSIRWLAAMIIKGGESTLDRPRRTPLSSLTPEEKNIQAWMILNFVGRMRAQLRASIEARYTRDVRRSAAQELLNQEVLKCLTGISHRRMIYELVARHYGKRVHLGMLARRFDVHRNTVMAKRQTVERELGYIEARADSQIILYLQMSGLIE